MDKTEKRTFASSVGIDVEKREEGEVNKIVGTILYGVPSKELDWFTEIIMPGAFDDVLKDDIRALFNHNPDLILGRTKSGTMKIQLTEKGLGFEIFYPDTSCARDLVESIRRGDIDAVSFAFRTKDVEWIDNEDGTSTRKILKFSMLQDISPVTYPAYPDMYIDLRGEYEASKQARKLSDDDPDDDLAGYEKRLHMITIDN